MADQPNVLIIYTDQQRYDTLGVNGNPLIRTPNLDALAASGVHFNRAYVTTPICVSSRVGLFTGRYCHSTLCYNNAELMPPQETDYVQLFKNAGYRTALIGKDHCFPGERKRRVFDTVRGAGHTSMHFGASPDEEKINEFRKTKMQVPMSDDPFPPETNITGSLFAAARDYVADRQDDAPFFMWLSIPDPHPPYMVCEPYASMYDNVEVPPPVWEEGETDNKPFRQRKIVEWDRYGREYPEEQILKLRRIYWGMVSYIDDEVGKLLARLDELGLRDDTIVVFTSDHGDYMGDHRMIRKGPHVYEALAHVPLIASWPGTFEARSTEAMTSNIDILPTLAALIGIESPTHVHGRSFADLLLGKREDHRPCVFLEHGNPGPVCSPETLTPEIEAEICESTSHHLCPAIYQGRVKGVRTERWKYCITPGDVDELYDLENDPNELHNLAEDPQYASVVCEHRDLILEWLIETEDTQAALHQR